MQFCNPKITTNIKLDNVAEVPMSVSSILLSGMQGMQAGINRTNIASSRISGFDLSTNNSDMAANMVALSQGSNDAKMAANVIKTGDAILGTLIDMHA